MPAPHQAPILDPRNLLPHLPARQPTAARPTRPRPARCRRPPPQPPAWPPAQRRSATPAAPLRRS
eukprot:157146-Chlamydomonas_euryale.AAC.10